VEAKGVWILIGLIALAHLFMAYFVTIELNDYPLLNKSKKAIWYLFIWLLPVVGTLLAYRKLKIKSNSSAGAGGANQVEWYAGNENDSHGGTSD
jgi:hypothetical protein